MMMRRWLLLMVLGLGLSCVQAQRPAAEESPASGETATAPAENPNRGKITTEISGATLTLDYGRPALEGRDMLSRLPDGEVWRLGKDAATGFTSSANLAFGETQVAAGSYTLFVRKKSADEWILLVNSQTGIWGTNHKSESDVAQIPLERSEPASSVERFTAAINAAGDNGGELVFEWGTLRLRAGFTVQR